MRALTYSRVSTADQKPEIQVGELNGYCRSRGWDLTEEIIDHGFSGGTDKRPGLKRLFELVRTRQVDCVVVLKLDRLFRSLHHLLSTLEEFQSLGVQFVAVRDHIDYTSPSGRLFVSLLGSFAQFEKDLCRERTLMGLAHARANGKRLGRPVKHSSLEIQTLHGQGLSYREIQKRVGAPMGCVARALKTARKSPSEFTISESRKPGGYDG